MSSRSPRALLTSPRRLAVQFLARRAPRRPLSLRFWIALGVVLLVSASVTTAIVASFERTTVSSAQSHVRAKLRPALNAELGLLTAYVNRETGQRGYLLTGDPTFLQPYTQGTLTTNLLQAELVQLVANDPQSIADAHAVIAAGQAWQNQTDPEIALRALGPIPSSQMIGMVSTGRTLFDAIRTPLAALTNRTESLVGAQLKRVTDAQEAARTVTNATLIAAILLALIAMLALQRLFTRPVRRFLAEVQAVATGDRTEPIDARGTREMRIVAEAVEHMRANVVRQSAERAAVEQRLSVREERDRMAADLHDLTIQRVFALGLSLHMLAAREQSVSSELEPIIDETDHIIRELRNVIFAIGHDDAENSLRSTISGLVHDSRRSLGFVPELDLQGPIDTAPPPGHVIEALLAVLRELLSNVARHAHATEVLVAVRHRDDQLELTVADNGIGATESAISGNGTRNIRNRAERLSGWAKFRSTPGQGTTVHWQVPLEAKVAAVRT